MARIIELQRQTKCADCGAELEVGTLARYYRADMIFGTSCHEDTRIKKCIGCGGAATMGASRGSVCGDCYERLDWIHD